MMPFCCGEVVALLTQPTSRSPLNSLAPLVNRSDLQEMKKQLGVPDDLTSCHTATVDRYVIEGHVPPADIKRLLEEKPAARGLSVPGMPVGSPGMEVEGQPNEAFTVWLFQEGGERTAFAQHGAS